MRRRSGREHALKPVSAVTEIKSQFPIQQLIHPGIPTDHSVSDTAAADRIPISCLIVVIVVGPLSNDAMCMRSCHRTPAHSASQLIDRSTPYGKRGQENSDSARVFVVSVAPHKEPPSTDRVREFSYANSKIYHLSSETAAPIFPGGTAKDQTVSHLDQFSGTAASWGCSERRYSRGKRAREGSVLLVRVGS